MQDSRWQRKTRHENAVCGLFASADTFCVSHWAIGWLLDQCNGLIRIAESLGLPGRRAAAARYFLLFGALRQPLHE
jgi:hypothetical protein